MKEGSCFLLFLITPNGDFVMSAKRIEIANKLLVDFPSGRATQSELMEWAVANGYSKYAPSFVWKSEYRVDRGIFRIPSETEIKTGTLDVPMEVVAAETAKCSIDQTGTAMDGNLNCTNRKTGTTVATAAQTALSDFKNSYDSTKTAIVITGTPEQGQTLISQSGSDITISTCFEEGCESADFMKNDVSVE